MINEKDPCTIYPDTEECIMPSIIRWFVCPIAYKNSECQQKLEEMIDELLFIEQLNLKWGKKVD